MREFRQGRECRVLEQECPYADRESYKDSCGHCLLHNAAEVMLEHIRKKEQQHAKETN